MRGLALLFVASCALTSKSEPLDIRYFDPEVTTPVATKPVSTPCGRARIGRITASADVQHRIAHRTSPVELELYETLRWTDRPDGFVRRSLSRSLFEDRPVEQALGGSVPTLDVEIVDFEQVTRGREQVGRVQLDYTLRGEHAVLAQGTITAERPAAGAAIELVVAAIGAAMQAATSQLADKVMAEVCHSTA